MLLFAVAENLGCSADFSKNYLLDFGTVRLKMDPFTHKGMTPNYMSPESCRQQHVYKSDLWAVAASVIYLYTYPQHPWAPETFEPRERAAMKDPRWLVEHVSYFIPYLIHTSI